MTQKNKGKVVIADDLKRERVFVDKDGNVMPARDYFQKLRNGETKTQQGGLIKKTTKLNH